MRRSLRTLALTAPVLLGVFLGFEAKPARAQYQYIGSPYGSPYYAQPGPFNYGVGAPGYSPYNPGYYSGGPRSWAPGYGWGYGYRRSWAPRLTPRQRYVLVPPSI
jgi:hypothetical protein